MSSSEAYILNKLQTPNGLWPVYSAIERGATTDEEISKKTGLPSSSVSEVLGGLRLLRMVQTSDYEHEVVETTWNTGKDVRDFQLTALEHLAHQAREGEWEKQAVVQLNYQYLIEKNIQRFENNQQSLYENIDSWIKRETEYRPKEGDAIYKHNKQKFGNWTRLVHQLGLVHKVSGREHIVYPDPQLILATIQQASQGSRYDPGADADVEIREYQNWLHENVLRIGEWEGGSVPAVLARVLATLAREGEIKLIEYGDAGSVDLANVPMSGQENIDVSANSIQIT
jgi:heme-degrading monooxygenase HmoA